MAADSGAVDSGAAESGAALSKVDLAQLRVLIVEDIDMMRNVLLAMLQAIGIGDCVGCASGARGLELLAEQPYDLVFCDLTMAPMDGLEFLRRVRGNPDPQFAALPVVILTGRTESSCRTASLGAGASAFAVKPVSLASLLDLVRQAVG
jgi:two-component system chemotaxis response regulator CheY